MFGLIPFRRRNESDSLSDLFPSMEEFFSDDFFSPAQRKFKCDIRESKKDYKIDAELPGFDKGDITIEYENNYLTIRAKREEETKVEDESFIRQERHHGEFLRRFYIDNVDESNIKAKFKNGILRITLPKREKELKTTNRIEIE